MPVSRRRRERRLCLGANRKLSTVRWIFRQTVGVCQLFGAPYLVRAGNAKADEGAEKSSSTMHVRKRKRGQRVGKRRSRGDKPRSNSPIRPPQPKGGDARRINHSGRVHIWGQRARSKLVNSNYFRVLDESISRIDTDRDRDAARELISPHWASHLRSLRRHARKVGIPDGANPFGKSALDFVLTNSRLIVPEMAFHDILGGLFTGLSPSAFHEKTAGADAREEMVPGSSEPPAQEEESPMEEDPWGGDADLLRRIENSPYPVWGSRRPAWMAPVPRPATSGIVRPWERQGARNRRRRRPS